MNPLHLVLHKSASSSDKSAAPSAPTSYTPPESVVSAAKRALAARAEASPSNKGGTSVGLATARLLASGRPVSLAKVRHIAAYFPRHEGDKSGETWASKGKGWQAWHLWGGDAGWAWARRIVERADRVEKSTVGVELPEALGAVLWNRQESLEKALPTTHKGKRPTKYVRREPKPGGGYRYFYSNTSTARGAKEGERVNLRTQGTHEILEAGDKIRLRNTETGAERDLTHDEFHAALASVYKARFEAGAERLVRRVVAEASKFPATGSSEDVFAAYAERFKSAGVDQSHAKRLVAFLSERPKWQDDARRALLSLASDAAAGKRIAPVAQQVIRGAENLRDAAGAAQVTASHVGQAALLRIGTTGDATDRILDLQATAREEIGRVKASLGAIEAAGSNEAARRLMVDYANQTMGAIPSALPELEHMATAYPGLRNLPELAALRELQGRWAAVSAEHGGRKRSDGGMGVPGAETTVFVSDAAGNATPQRARYRLVEAGEAIASHDPARNFAPRPEYPEGVQERAYHRDKAEQEKVRSNAQRLQPAYVVNTNPDAVNGPPVMTADGVVLGGNSRTMSIQTAYADHPDKATAYRDFLEKHAHEFGFTDKDVSGMKSPMLVREVQVDDAGHGNLATLVRRYNESFTQAMDPRVDQVARGRLVTKAMLDTLGHQMSRENSSGELLYPTLREFLGSSAGRSFVDDLSSAREGKSILDKRTRSAYVGKDGKLNEDGKTLVERVLVGHLLPDPDLLSDLLPSHVSAVAASVPHMVRAAAAGHDVTGPVREALESAVYMRRHGLRTLGDLNATQTLGDFASGAGFESKPQPSPMGQKLAESLVGRGLLDKPAKMAAYFRDFATLAARNPAGQSQATGAMRSTGDLLDLTEGRQGDSGGQMGMFKSTPAQPTEAQKQAGNYEKKRVRFAGLLITLEHEPGGVREGVDSSGKPWRTVMCHAYGYIRGTEGADGDQVDVFLGPNEDARNVYVVHQVDPDTDRYDEDKCMLGFDSEGDAVEAYRQHYDRPDDFVGEVSAMPLSVFKRLLRDGDGAEIVPGVRARLNRMAKSLRGGRRADRIPGGLADKKRPSDFDAEALAEGIAVEREHTSDQAIAEEIAMDHLAEDPEYYRKLRRIEGASKGPKGTKPPTRKSLHLFVCL